MRSLDLLAPRASPWCADICQHRTRLFRLPKPVTLRSRTDLPSVARPLFASHRASVRRTNEVLDAWHAVNCLREWRGDTHWAIVASQGLSGDEASILHNGWLRYEGDWLSLSRGNSPESIAAAWESLQSKSLARDGVLLPKAFSLRQWIEDETNLRTTLPWELLGAQRSRQFAREFEPPCEALLERVNLTASEQYQPASRQRARWHVTT